MGSGHQGPALEPAPLAWAVPQPQPQTLQAIYAHPQPAPAPQPLSYVQAAPSTQPSAQQLALAPPQPSAQPSAQQLALQPQFSAQQQLALAPPQQGLGYKLHFYGLEQLKEYGPGKQSVVLEAKYKQSNEFQVQRQRFKSVGSGGQIDLPFEVPAHRCTADQTITVTVRTHQKGYKAWMLSTGMLNGCGLLAPGLLMMLAWEAPRRLFNRKNRGAGNEWLGGWSTLLYPCPWINLKRCKDGYRVLGTATIKLADLASRPPGAAVKVPIVSRFGSKHGFLCFTASDGLCPIEFRENTPEELHQLRMHKDMCDRLQKANEAAAMAAAMRMYY